MDGEDSVKKYFMKRKTTVKRKVAPKAKKPTIFELTQIELESWKGKCAIAQENESVLRRKLADANREIEKVKNDLSYRERKINEVMSAISTIDSEIIEEIQSSINNPQKLRDAAIISKWFKGAKPKIEEHLYPAYNGLTINSNY
jgi:predicted  nucleic acid-binding Zn-ribbon protein